MRKTLTIAPLALLLVFGTAYAAKTPAKDQAQQTAPIPPERTVKTEHEARIGGHSIDYTATAGTLNIRDEKGNVSASVFYIAYTKKGVDKLSQRPVTFLYNGGPGSSSIWLHMGAFGPVRVQVADGKATPPPPYDLVDNQYSLLDKSDLVFIDAIGTGFSKPVGKAKGKDFWGVDEDIAGFAKFITRYVTVNNRWDSPKFLLGESYGTTRSAALVDYLQQQGMAFNGVTLVSSVLNYGIGMPGTDLSYELYLPTFAAIAYYHDKLPHKPADLKSFLKQVRHFAVTDYAEALAQGQNLSAADENAIAQQLHNYTGLSATYLKQANLRVDASRFRKELLRGERRTVGRYDGRFEGIDMDAAGERPNYDASDTAIGGAFNAAFHYYLTNQLNYTADVPYKLTNYHIIREWDWKHTPPGRRRAVPLPYVAGDLGEALRTNPHLKVFSANGYFDLATPFFKTEYDISHMELDPSLTDHVQFGYYPSGHMIYLHVPALKDLKGDLAKFYDAATRH